MPSLPTLLADSINPLSALLLLAAPFVTPRRVPTGEYWGRCVLSIGLAVILAESGKRWEVWPRHPGFPQRT